VEWRWPSASTEELGQELEARRAEEPDLDAQIGDDVGDGLLRLMFIACHPVLSREVRARAEPSAPSQAEEGWLGVRERGKRTGFR
jgi:hypothetical protein